MSNISGFVKRIRDIMRNDAGINGDAQRIEQLAWILFLRVFQNMEDNWELEEEDYSPTIPVKFQWNSWSKDKKTGDVLLKFVDNELFPALQSLGAERKDERDKLIVNIFSNVNNYMKDGVLLRQVISVVDEIDLDDYEESHAFGEIYETILRELQSAGSAGEFYTPRAVTDFMAQIVDPQIGEKMADFACGTGGFITSWCSALSKKLGDADDVSAYQDSFYGIEKKQFPYLLCVTNLFLHGCNKPKIDHDNSLAYSLLDYTNKDAFDVILMNPPYGGAEKDDIKKKFPADLRSSETADLFMALVMQRLKTNGRAAIVLPDGFLFGADNAKLNLKKQLLDECNLHTVIRLPGSVFSPYTSITTNLLFFDKTGKTATTWFYRLDMPEGYKHFSKTKPMKLEHFAPVAEWWNDRREIVVDGFDKAKCFTYEQLTQDLAYNLDQCGFPHKEEEILDPLDLIQRYEEERASLNAEIDRVLQEIAEKIGGNKQ